MVKILPPLLDAVLLDYKKNIAEAREAEVLATMSIIVNKLEHHITKEVPKIFDAVFECTLLMINRDFEEFPEHRKNFFMLLQAVNQHCFPALLHIQPPQFKLGNSRTFFYTKTKQTPFWINSFLSNQKCSTP